MGVGGVAALLPLTQELLEQMNQPDQLMVLTRSSSVLKLWSQGSVPSCLQCVRPTIRLSTFNTTLNSAEETQTGREHECLIRTNSPSRNQ